MAVRTRRALQLCKQPTQPPLLINVLDPNGPVRRLDLDLVALPLVAPDQVEITDKASPRGAALTELGRVLDDRVADGDAAVVRGDGQEPLKGTRDGELDGPVGGTCRQ